MKGDSEPEPTTAMQCPATNCEQGSVITRKDLGTGYSVSSHPCAYCGGTGLVTPVRYAAWFVVTKDGQIPEPECE